MKEAINKAQVILQKESKDLTLSDFLIIYDLLTTKRLIHPSLYRITKDNVKWVYQQKEVDEVILQLKIKYSSLVKNNS